MSHSIDILHMVKDVFEDIEFDTNATSELCCLKEVDLDFDLQYGGDYEYCSSESGHESDSSVESLSSTCTVSDITSDISDIMTMN